MNHLFKSKLLEILIEIDRICNENNLRYFLTGGTLLGAIRHKGFIPWDDDIDIAMPRPDYECLKRISSTTFDKRFKLTTIENDKKYYCRYAKVYHQETTLVEYEYPFYVGGIFVDVFPLDGMPDDKLDKHYSQYTKAKNKLFKLYVNPHDMLKEKNIYNFFRYYKYKLYHFFYNIPDKIKICETIAQKYTFDRCKYIANLNGAWGKREITKKEYFEDYILADFEGYKFRIPKGYHSFLTGLYGDYMTLPPIEKQISHHSHYFLDLKKKLSFEEIQKILHKTI